MHFSLEGYFSPRSSTITRKSKPTLGAILIRAIVVEHFFFFLFVPVFNDIVDQWFCVSSDCLLAIQTAGPIIIIVVVAMLFAM